MSDEIDSIQDSIKSAVKERLGNPLFGAFAISWSVANWEFLLILFRGTEPVQEKITLLHTGYMSASKMVFVPLLAAIIISAAYPWINLLFGMIRRYPVSRMQAQELQAGPQSRPQY